MSPLLAELEKSLGPSYDDKMSDWMEANIVLPEKGNERPGPIQIDDWQREPYDAMGDPSVRVLVWMWSSQSGKSLGLSARIARSILTSRHVPMFASSTDTLIKRFCEDKFDALISCVPDLVPVIATNQKDGCYFRDGIYSKTGKVVEFGSSRAVTKLKSFTTPEMIADEYEDFKVLTGDSGTPFDLMYQRGARTRNPQLHLTSTPGTEGESLIEDAFLRTDMRERFCACIHCGEGFQLELEVVGQVEIDNELIWHIICPACGTVITEEERQQMITDDWAIWIRTNPDADPSFVGYHINQFHLPTVSVHETMKTFREEDLHGFMTQVMGRPHKREELPMLGEEWLRSLHGSEPDMPLLSRVAGVDSQFGKDARYEVTIADFHGEVWHEPQVYVRTHYVVPVVDEKWREATREMLASLRSHQVDCGFIDIGSNEGADKIKTLLRTVGSSDFITNRIKAIKATGVENDAKWAETPIIHGEYRFDDLKTPYSRTLTVYSSIAKLWTMRHLHEGHTILGEPRLFGDDYYRQLGSEWLERYVTAAGVERRRWRKKVHVRNEALDCLVYCYACYVYLGPTYKTRVGKQTDMAVLNALMGIS